MAIDPNAEYLINRGNTSYRVKSGNLSNVGTSGDYIFYDAGNGTSRKVEFTNWSSVPDNAKLLVNYGGASYYVTGANFKADSIIPPFPSGTRYVKFSTENGVGQTYHMANNNLGNYGGSSASGGQGGTATIRCFLIVGATQYSWEKGDTFNFYLTSPNSGNASVKADGQNIVSPGSWNSSGPGWAYTYTLNAAAMNIEFNVNGGEVRISSTRVNGETALDVNGATGILPNYRPTRTITENINTLNTPISVNGFFPLYFTPEAAIAASPTGTYHTHALTNTEKGNRDWYMPEGVAYNHGDYSG